MNQSGPDIHAGRGLAAFTVSRQDNESPVWRRFIACLREELAVKRMQNDAPATIQDTTLLRGEIALVKRILARADEVGPESRQSEPQWPESALPARAVTGLPEGY